MILITKNKDHINSEIPPAYHLTNKFILNPVKDSRSAPTRIQNHGLIIRHPWKRSPYKQVSDVLCYKLIPIIYRTLLLQTLCIKMFGKMYIGRRNTLTTNTWWRDLQNFSHRKRIHARCWDIFALWKSLSISRWRNSDHTILLSHLRRAET